jgi:hypothetical protein
VPDAADPHHHGAVMADEQREETILAYRSAAPERPDPLPLEGALGPAKPPRRVGRWGRRLIAATAVALVAWVPLSYSLAVKSGRSTVPYVRQFEQTFPGSSHSISYFTGTHGPTHWNSNALVHGRYTLTMQMSLRLSLLRNRIVSAEEPRFWLVEIESLSVEAGRVTAIQSGGAQVTFGPAEWQRVVDSGGDLSQLGIQVHRDRPVPGLVEDWRRRNH